MSIVPGITSQPTRVTDGSIRGFFYARYSSDGQSRASIPDQFRNCAELARRKGWTVLEHLNQFDEEMTGRTKFGRKGLDAVLAIAKTKPRIVDYLICDDTSRLGRNAAETLQTVQVLLFQGIALYFVEDGLDSRDPSFWENFTSKAVGDERYSRSLGAKVKRGRRGRFIEGYNPGGGCYGYRNLPVYDHTRKGYYGMPYVKAVRQEIDPETSLIVLRIFNAYAGGMSFKGIASMLNQEGIPTSQGPRSKREASWSRGALRTILANTRYIGKIAWGTTVENIDPESGRRVREDVPQELWDTREAPELRIISDELWAKVQAVRGQKVTFGIQKTGGMERTAASRRYLLSGLMKCGQCDGNINVATSNPTRYGCTNHRNRGKEACSNRTTIRQDELEQAFVAALADKLRAEDLREELIQALHAHLVDQKRIQDNADMAALEQKEEMVANRAKYLRHQANLLKAIREEGGCRSIYEDLKEVEGKIARINERLSEGERAPVKPITVEEVRDFVNGHADRFEELLIGSAEQLKAEFQKRITSITLTPGIDEQGPFYTVSGDVDLFALPQDAVQTNPAELIALHYNIPIAFNIHPYTNRPSWALEKAA
jgi:DNA invertase Pin-like site-specific DNA recombinase